MKRPIAISLSPNTSPADVRLAGKLLFLHSYWKNPAALSRAAERLAPYFPGRFLSFASSGRQALYDLLRVYGIGTGDEVIIQAFTCIAVPEPLLWLGIKPVYADVAEGSYSVDLEDVKKKITPKTKAIIVQHTFGIPGPIEEIVALAQQNGIVVIEDCAHALGGMLNGKHLGTFGDAAIASFGRDKCVSSVFGGAVILKDKNKLHELQQLQRSRKLPPASWVAQQLLHPVIFSIVLPLYFTAGIGKALLVVAQKVGLLSRAVEYKERIGSRPVHIDHAYSPALALLLGQQLEKLPHMVKRRREIARRYQEEIHALSEQEKAPHADAAWLRFPLRTPHAKAILQDARAKGMLLGDWYDAPLVPAASYMKAFEYTEGSCPRAEAASKEIINLPTYAALTDTQVTTIIDFMNSYGNSRN